MKEKLHFESLKAAHLAEVQEIEERVFSDPWSSFSYQAELVNPIACYFAGLMGEKVIAYGGYWKVLEEGHITNIAVHPDVQKRGIGTQLVRVLMDHAIRQGIERMTLEVRVSNAPALACYQKLGFRSVGVRPHYYPDGEDADILWLELIK